MSQQNSTNKPFYKKWWFMAIAVFVVFAIFLEDDELDSSDNDLDDVEQELEFENKEIEEDKDEKNEDKEEIVEDKQLEDLMKDEFTLEFDTGLDLSGGISDEDYEKYNAIMSELSSDWDRSEQEIYADIAHEYNSTAEELESFMRENSNAVIERDFKGGESIKEKDVDKFVTLFMNENFDAEIEISNIEYNIPSYRAISHFDFKIKDDNYDATHSAILKFEYDVSNNYKTASAFQFKIDEKNIDEVSDKNK